MPRPQWTVRGTVGTNGQTTDISATELRALIQSDGYTLGGSGGPHTHATSEVVGLVDALAGKAASGHDHAGVYATTSHGHSGADLTNGTVTLSKLSNMTAARVLGSIGGGAPAEMTASQVVDLIGSTRGSLIYRGASAWSLLGQGSAGQVLTSGGAGVDPTWTTVAGGGDSVVVLGADVTNNNAVANTMQDVTGLQFPVINGQVYWFEFTIAYTAALTTTGSRWSINGPTVTHLSYRSEYPLTATTMTTNFLSAYNVPAASNATSLTAGNTATIWGIVRPSADGNVVARFASEVAGSAIVAKAGSVVKYRRTL